MKVGDVTEVLRTQRGYQILKLESRSETRIRSFDDARGDISNKVAAEKSAGERMKYLERLRSQATITWHNDELKKAYEQALAERRKVGVPQPDPMDRDDQLVCALDALAPRAGRARAARAEANRGVPADDYPVEPLEGSQEEDRLAALSRLLLRALRSRASGCPF